MLQIMKIRSTAWQRRPARKSLALECGNEMLVHSTFIFYFILPCSSLLSHTVRAHMLDSTLYSWNSISTSVFKGLQPITRWQMAVFKIYIYDKNNYFMLNLTHVIAWSMQKLNPWIHHNQGSNDCGYLMANCIQKYFSTSFIFFSNQTFHMHWLFVLLFAFWRLCVDFSFWFFCLKKVVYDCITCVQGHPPPLKNKNKKWTIPAHVHQNVFHVSAPCICSLLQCRIPWASILYAIPTNSCRPY